MWDIIQSIAGAALVIWIYELHRKVDRLTTWRRQVKHAYRSGGPHAVDELMMEDD